MMKNNNEVKHTNSGDDFRDWAHRYDEVVAKGVAENDWMYGAYLKVLATIEEYCRPFINKSAVVIDIGTGTGEVARLFLGKVKEVIGIDPSPAMLAQAKKKFPELELISGDFLSLNLPIGTKADIVVTSYAFHHLTDREKRQALDSMFSLLKPKGVMVIADLMFRDKKEEKKLKPKLGQEIVEEIETEFYGYVEHLSKILAGYGLSVQSQQISGLVWVICGQRSAAKRRD